MNPSWSTCFILVAVFAAQQIMVTGSKGVCWGMKGDNLPSPADVIALLRKCQYSDIRLYNPNPQVQELLLHASFSVALGVLNEDLANLAGSPDAASAWVNTNIVPYRETQYRYITVGNEVIPGPDAQFVVPAMRNLRTALNAVGLGGLTITTVVSSEALGTSYPPSQGAFSPQAVKEMTDVVSFLSSEGNKPLLINVYPYFAYAADPKNVDLAYAQFFSTYPKFQDGDLSYYNLFDAMVDAFYSAMERVGGGDVGIAVAETGWPSAGNGEFTTPDLAQRYNFNFWNHIMGAGTPKRPNIKIFGYIFAMFNENLKPAGVEQNFGLFYPNDVPVYSFPCN